jgi:hypothetical protein
LILFKDSTKAAPPGKIFKTGSGILNFSIISFTFLIACKESSTVIPLPAEVPLLPEVLATPAGVEEGL